MEVALGLLAELPLEMYITHEFRPEDASDAYTTLDNLANEVVQCVFAFSGGA